MKLKVNRSTRTGQDGQAVRTYTFTPSCESSAGPWQGVVNLSLCGGCQRMAVRAAVVNEESDKSSPEIRLGRLWRSFCAVAG